MYLQFITNYIITQEIERGDQRKRDSYTFDTNFMK